MASGLEGLLSSLFIKIKRKGARGETGKSTGSQLENIPTKIASGKDQAIVLETLSNSQSPKICCCIY